MYRCLYPVRATELPWIKRRRLKECRNIIGEEPSESDRNYELTTYEFILISSMYEININYLIAFLDLMVLHGGVAVCLAYIIFTIILGMPLYMLFTFMSSYSKKSYLKFWDCAPLFEGLGYTLALMRLTTEIYNTTVAGVCMVLIPDIFNWKLMQKVKNCDFGDVRCMPMYSVDKRTASCNFTQNEISEISKMNFTASQYYVRFYALKFNIDATLDAPEMNMKFLVTIAITWFMVFAVGIHGIKRIRRITVNLQLIFMSILIGIAAIIFVSREGREQTISRSTSMEKLFRFSFWTDIMVHSAETNVLCNMIWLGAIKPKKLRPRCAALITTPIKLVFMVALVCVASKTIHKILNIYNISDEKCLMLSGFDILIILIPDLLHRTHISGLLKLLWYVSLLYYSFIAPLYTVIGLVDSITQKYEKLHNYRLCVYLVLCSFGFLANTPLLLNSGMYIIKIWRFYGMPMLTAATLLLVVLAICFIYSTKQIIDDYTFAFGRPPEKYWVVFWETSPIFAIFAFIFVLDQVKYNEKLSLEINMLKILSYCQCTSILLPVFVIVCARCFKHITFRTLSDLSKSAETWGPFQDDKRETRKLYYPHRNIKCLNPVLKCNHKCIHRNNVKYMDEIAKQDIKIENLKLLVQKYLESNQ